ncbi:MAG: hypothetical protein HYX86_03650 [Chloroflexi bacterium]|nr:hypothetical protein [Chloroflexota bacterium]
MRFGFIAMAATFATLLLACQPATPPSLGGDLVLEYHRSGGFVGSDEQWLIYGDGRVVYRDLIAETEEEIRVSADAVADLVALMESEGFFSFQDSYLPDDTCCDRFIYEITLHYQGQSKTVTTIDAAEGEPEGLGRILAELNRLLGEIM